MTDSTAKLKLISMVLSIIFAGIVTGFLFSPLFYFLLTKVLNWNIDPNFYISITSFISIVTNILIQLEIEPKIFQFLEKKEGLIL